MKVKVFDYEHEMDLEEAINNFLESSEITVIDIKFSVSASIYSSDQIYCFSALIIYE